MEPNQSLAEDEKAALLVLLRRYSRLYDKYEADKKIQLEIEQRLAAHDEQFKLLNSAMAVFGFEASEDRWKKIQDLVGPDAYAQAVLPLGDVQRKNSLQVSEALPSPSDDVEVRESTVRELVLGSLKAARDKGRKASEIQAEIEAARSRKLHEKTVGMTLYRLSQEGLAHREGRTWFFVSPETKNLGGGAPRPNVFE